MSVSVVIADDHAVVRSGLSSLLKDTEIQVVGEAEDGEQAIAETLKCSPDVVLMDIRMGGTDGLDALEKIRARTADAETIAHYFRTPRSSRSRHRSGRAARLSTQHATAGGET